MSLRKHFDLSVYFVADPAVCKGRPLDNIVRQAVEGGATMVQLRDKSSVYKDAVALAAFLKSKNIPFIINDNVEVALAVNTDGVHLGQEDMSPAEARKLLGPDKIIGVTAFEEKHFKAIDPNIVDYAGTGLFYATQTKPGKPVLGAEAFARLVKISPVPVVGIGGVTPENASFVMKAGAKGVAMMRSISESDDPALAAANFLKAVR